MYVYRFILILIVSLFASGCASIMSSATQDLANNLSMAILNQNDPPTVRDGAPSFLIMVDSFAQGSPENIDLKRAASRLYGAYASAFVTDEERRIRLAQKSFDYAHDALCEEIDTLCAAQDIQPELLRAHVEKLTLADLPIMYDFAAAWSGWVQANSGDWNALAQIPKLKILFERSIELDETHDRGGAHLYLGVLTSQIPPSLGGKPEVGRAHFEKALAISKNQNKMVHVLFAQHYARLVFDQDLHDSLLQQALQSDDEIPGLVLMNALARERAGKLLAESSDFF